jgi:integrase
MARGRVYYRVSRGSKAPRSKGRWYIDYFFNGRRVREGGFENKALADRELRRRLYLVDERKHPDVRAEKGTRFDVFAEKYVNLHSRPNNKSSRNNDELCIKRFNSAFGDRYLHQINTPMVEEYKASRAKVVAPASVNRELAVLKAMFNKAICWGDAETNPVKPVRLFKENNQRVRYLEKEEIQKLLAHCSANLRAIVVVLLNTGMRKGELQSLQWKDIEFRNGIITVRQSKSGKSRHIPMNSVVREALISVRKHPESGYIFCGADGQPFNFRKSFETALRRCGIKDFRIHDLRHTFASHLVMSGVDLNTVRELLGHSSMAMTLRYTHLSPDHKARAVEVLSAKTGTALAPKASSDEKPKEELTASSFQLAI